MVQDKALVLKIITPDAVVFQEHVQSVSLMGIQGSFGVLPGHAPFITQLKVAPARTRVGDKELVFSVRGGLCKVLDKHVTILTDAAELVQKS